jgi:hypothetical protein
MRLDLPPLLVAQPEQVASHLLPRALTAENQQPILPATELLGFDPRALPEVKESGWGIPSAADS